MRIYLLVITLFFLQIIFVKAQIISPSTGLVYSNQNNNFNNSSHCATDEMSKELYKKYPERKKQAEAIDDAIYKILNNNSSTKGARGTVYFIPVVVHIIHNNGPENISNAQVLQGIQDLNEAFSNTGGFQDANGVDVEIQFCLAQRDPNGNATNGITRDVSSLTNLTMETDDINLKNLNRWNPNDYLNIWLVKEITSLTMGSGVAGYAYLPSSHGKQEDGVVNEANFFGGGVHGSKVHVHEVGHYLGLYHTFQGGCTNNNCLLDGDMICDTPPDNSTAVVPCNGTINTCATDDDDLSTNNPFRPIANGGLGDQNDLFHDHMDYGDIPCHTLFTNGQKDRMRIALTTARASLLQSQGCITPCTNLISISFTASATSVIIGTNVIFTNTSTGTIINYDWSINNTSFATTQNSNYLFNTVGNYWVVLTENNNDPNCKKQDSVLIKVICNAQASFTSSAASVQPGGSLTFTSTSTGATSYQWFIDGIPQVSTPNFTNTFNTAGGYMVYLVVCSANCCDTSNYQFIKVGICTNKEANIWYFEKDAGVDFNSGLPIALTNNAMGFSSDEGASVVSDKSGGLLFYSDGVTVWNKNHQIMQNGTGLWAGGTIFGSSTLQSSVIVKKPGSDSLYYIFTCDFQGGAFTTTFVPGAHAYSIVDMSLNGGLGAVIVKNQLVYAPTAERLAAVRHANGTDIWILTHEWNSDKIRAYLLTCNGLDTVPVISHTGIVATGNLGGAPGADAQGAITISSSAKKFVETYCNRNVIFTADFNSSSGQISNYMTLTLPSKFNQVWQTAFSTNEKALYFTGLTNNYNNTEVHQIDLTAGGASAILSTDVTLHISNKFEYYRAIQMASDGKIYISVVDTTFLSVIQNPNVLGAGCSFVKHGLDLSGKMGNASLPNFLVDNLSSKKASKIQGDTSICNISSYYIKNNCGVGGDSLVWLLNGNSTILSHQGDSITIKPIQAGNDTLISIQYAACGVVADTLIIHTQTNGVAINIGKDTTICNPNNLQLNAGSGFNNYLWSTNATTQNINVITPGTYWVEVTASSGCKSRDTIIVVQGNTKPNVNLGADKIVCLGKVIPMDAGAGYMNYTWSDNTHNQNFTAWLPGIYWVTVIDSCGNKSSDTIKVIADNSGTISLGSDTELCDNETLVLDAGNGFISYLWQDGSTNQTYTAIDTGTYAVHVLTQDGCSYSDTIRIDDCTIKIKDCEIGIPDAFSPNGDGMNDEFKILGKCIDKITLVIYDRWGEKVFETTNPTQGWDGTDKGKKFDNGVFAYYLKVTTYKGTEFTYKGNVSLIK